MPIEFLCPSCQQQLRVPDAAAGKNARCPGCSTIAKVPETSQPPAANPLSPPAQPGFNFGPPEPKPSAPSGGSFGAPPAGNPFGDLSGQGYGGSTFGGAGVGGGGPINPYASPAGTYGGGGVLASGPGGQQIVDFGTVFNYSFKVWQDNLGLLVGTTLVFYILLIVANIVAEGMKVVVVGAGEPAITIAAVFFVELLKLVIQSYLQIGLIQISLKVARQQRAEFGDLFGGGSRLLPVLGLVFLIAIAVYLPLIVAVGVAAGVAGAAGGGGDTAALIILPVILLWVVALITAMLYFWPAYFLVVDGRAKVLESFGKAVEISRGNKLNIFVLWIISVLVIILGFLAVCIGLLFAIPLAILLFSVAYLMMSGQIPAHATYQR